MKNVLRQGSLSALGAAAVVAVLTAAGCPTTETPVDAGSAPKCENDPVGCCSRPADCGKNRFDWVCSDPDGAKICKRLCSSASDCTAPETCDDGICRPPACGNDSECGNGEQCSGGSCVPAYTASGVASCQVLPTKAVLHQGSAKTFTIVAKDSTGKAIGYKGDVTWSASNGNATVSGTSITGSATGGTSEGAVDIKAKVGGTDCTASAAINYTTNTEGLRVVVADLLSGEPISGATVVAEGSSATTDSNGVAALAVSPGDGVTLSVYADEAHSYVTYVGITGRDQVVYLKPAAKPGLFTGSMPSASFNGLSDEQGNVRLALFGGSIPGNLIDLQLSNLIGEIDENNPTTIKFGSTEVEVPLPGGIVMGLGDNMFKSDYKIPATPGVRAIWGIGGNARIEAITSALQPVISGGTDNIDVGPILAGILPLLGRLQSGVTAGVNVVAEQTSPLAIALNTLLRIKLEAHLPDLPPYTIDGATARVDGAIVLGGSLYNPQGLIPLGLTAGLDIAGGPKDENGKDTPDGKTDPEAGGQPGVVTLKVAPMHGGLETSKYTVLALGASFSGLAGGLGGDPAPDAPPPPPVVLMGLVAFPDAIGFKNGEANSVNFRQAGFISVPSDVVVTNGRSVSLGSPVADATFHRLDIGDQDSGEWFIYFAGNSAADFRIPVPPEGKADRFNAQSDGADAPGLILQSVSVTGGATFQSLAAFDAVNFDDLTTSVDAFTTRGVDRTILE